MPEELGFVRFGGAPGEFGFGVTNGAEIALPHQHPIIRADKDAPKRVMAMGCRLSGDSVRGPEVGDHLVSRHGTVLSGPIRSVGRSPHG
ncbi:hypothetical protein GCM10011321_11530 [Youhaiella tibetensis]|nr:hypothetical protein GCM10011321_11530 [Youhaiella tibetensis]